MGLTAEGTAANISRVEPLLGAERLAIVKNYADQAAAEKRQAQQASAGGALGVITNLRDYAASLSAGNASAGTALDRYGASQRQFDEVFGAASAGDARSITGLRDAAETFRTNAREVCGGGQGYADAIRMIGDRISTIGHMQPEALTQSFMAENARANTDRLRDGQDAMIAEIAALRRDLGMLMMRPAA